MRGVCVCMWIWEIKGDNCRFAETCSPATVCQYTKLLSEAYCICHQ